MEGAEVTFWAADDGVLTLRSYAPPDLWGTFHQRQPLAVVTGTSLMGLLAEDPAELARLKVQMRAAEIYDLDRQQSRAHRIGAALATGLTLDDVAAWPGLLQAVTPADVQAAARAVFRPEASVTGWLTAEEGR